MTAISETPHVRLADTGRAARALLRDHLEAALAHCDALLSTSLPLGASLATGATGHALLAQDRAVSTFVRDLKTRELAIGLRLSRARAIAATSAKQDSACRPLALLVQSGASLMVDASVEAGRHIKADTADIGDLAYLCRRGVVTSAAVALPAVDMLAIEDTFLVFGLMSLRDVSAFLNTALDALDVLS